MGWQTPSHLGWEAAGGGVHLGLGPEELLKCVAFHALEHTSSLSPLGAALT